MKNVLLLGGSGTLGKELLKINSERKDCKIYAPSSSKIDISRLVEHEDDRLSSLTKEIHEHKADLVVNCAAITDVSNIEKDPKYALWVNVVGACEVLLTCMVNNVKLVQISTDHVFDGKQGNYEVDSPINPLTKYAKTKAASELAVRTYDNSLVIRTSFFGHEFPFEKAFVDQFSSKDYVDIIAPMVYDAMLSDKVGVVHVCSERRSLYEIALERKKDVIPTSLQTFVAKYPIPQDTSLCKTLK